jgi:hypothetical protein
MGLVRTWEQFIFPPRAMAPHRMILTAQRMLLMIALESITADLVLAIT